MSRTVPSLLLQNPGNLVSSTLWNSGPKAMGDFYTAPPMFRAVQLTPQAFTSGAWTTIGLDSTSIDTEGGHSNSVNNSRYTAQVAGWYWVVGFSAWRNANAQADIYCGLAVNSSLYLGTAQVLQKMSGEFSALSTSGAIFLKVGDYVEVWARQNTGSSLSSWNTNTDLTPCMNLVWFHG